MKTGIIIAVVALIAFFGLRSVIKMLTGKGGCSCGDGGSDEHKCCGSGGCSCGHDHKH